MHNLPTGFGDSGVIICIKMETGKTFAVPLFSIIRRSPQCRKETGQKHIFQRKIGEMEPSFSDISIFSNRLCTEITIQPPVPILFPFF